MDNTLVYDFKVFCWKYIVILMVLMGKITYVCYRIQTLQCVFIMHISMKSEIDMMKVPFSFQETLFKLDEYLTRDFLFFLHLNYRKYLFSLDIILLRQMHYLNWIYDSWKHSVEIKDCHIEKRKLLTINCFWVFLCVFAE